MRCGSTWTKWTETGWPTSWRTTSWKNLLETRIVAFRIAQEALSNVRKHAGATQVTVTLAPRDEGYLVRIEDNGAGFDPTALEPARPGHLGLASMRERAEMASGWCTVESSPGSGSRVECWLPKTA